MQKWTGALVLSLATSALTSLGTLGTREVHSVEVQDPQFAIDVIHDGAGMVPLAFGPGGRMYVGEKTGRILVLEPDSANPGSYLPPVEFASLQGVVDSRNERGLLGLTLDVSSSSVRLYAFYSSSSEQRLVRFTSTSLTRADGPPETILEGLPFRSTTHNGGDIFFSDEGLFISLGDDRESGPAQDLGKYYGKILRVDANGFGLPDNPFYDGNPESVASRIWGLGCRNPFRFTFHAGAMYVSENGNSLDRVSRWGAAGANGGWPDRFEEPGDPDVVNLFTSISAITGIAIVRGGPFADPEFPGSDALYVANWKWGRIERWRLTGPQLDEAVEIRIGRNNDFVTGITEPVHLAFGPGGALFFTTSGNSGETGKIYRIRYVGEVPPPVAAIRTVPQPASGPAPLTVQFEDHSTGFTASRLWDFADGTTSSEQNPTHRFDSAGVYNVRLTVTDSFGLTDTASVRVSATRSVEVDLSGTIFDGRAARSRALASATEIRLFQLNGATPLPFPGGTGAAGNARLVPAGGQLSLVATVALTHCGLVIAAGGSASDGLQPAVRALTISCEATAHSADVYFYLSDAALSGRVTDTLGRPARVDLGVSAGAPGNLLAVAGGRDFLSPIPLSGVAHRVESDRYGYYYVPVPFAHAGSDLHLDVAVDTNQDVFLSTTFAAQIPAGTLVERDVVLGRQPGGASCDTLAAVDGQVDYAQVQAVFDANCTGCHSGLDPNAALDLSEGASYSAIANVASREVPGLNIVEPGDSSLSFLWEKLNCALPQVGSRMPTGYILPPDDRSLVRAWIDQGAIGPPEDFVRGDANADAWLDISDAVTILLHLFENAMTPCEKSADADDGGSLEMTDALLLVQWLFVSGSPAAEPMECGPDLTDDELTCDAYGPCD